MAVLSGGVQMSLVIMFCVQLVLNLEIIYSLSVFLVRLSGRTCFYVVVIPIEYRFRILSLLEFAILAKGIDRGIRFGELLGALLSIIFGVNVIGIFMVLR